MAAPASEQGGHVPNCGDAARTFSVGSRFSSPPRMDCTFTGPFARRPEARCTPPRAAPSSDLPIRAASTGVPRSASDAGDASVRAPCAGVAVSRAAAACGRPPRSTEALGTAACMLSVERWFVRERDSRQTPVYPAPTATTTRSLLPAAVSENRGSDVPQTRLHPRGYCRRGTSPDEARGLRAGCVCVSI